MTSCNSDSMFCHINIRQTTKDLILFILLLLLLLLFLLLLLYSWSYKKYFFKFVSRDGNKCVRPKEHYVTVKNEMCIISKIKVTWNYGCFRPRCCTVRLYWAGDNLGKWDELWYNHAPGARSITWPVNLQSIMLPLCYECPFSVKINWMVFLTTMLHCKTILGLGQFW